jgi:hypothetical protein
MRAFTTLFVLALAAVAAVAEDSKNSTKSDDSSGANVNQLSTLLTGSAVAAGVIYQYL